LTIGSIISGGLAANPSRNPGPSILERSHPFADADHLAGELGSSLRAIPVTPALSGRMPVEPHPGILQ